MRRRARGDAAEAEIRVAAGSFTNLPNAPAPAGEGVSGGFRRRSGSSRGVAYGATQHRVSRIATLASSAPGRRKRSLGVAVCDRGRGLSGHEERGLTPVRLTVAADFGKGWGDGLGV